MRKESDFDIADRITLYYNGDAKLDEVIKNYEDYIKDGVLALEIKKDESLELVTELNELKVALKVEKIKK